MAGIRRAASEEEEEEESEARVAPFLSTRPGSPRSPSVYSRNRPGPSLRAGRASRGAPKGRGARSGSPARPGGTITAGRSAPRSRSRGEVEKGWETQSLGRRTQAAPAQRETLGEGGGALCKRPQLTDDN